MSRKKKSAMQRVLLERETVREALEHTRALRLYNNRLIRELEKQLKALNVEVSRLAVEEPTDAPD